jgi:ABC-type ATPase involved in cell division
MVSTRMNRRQIPHLRREIGYVFQDFRLLEDRSVQDNVAFAQLVVGTPRAAIKKNVMRVLTQVGLWDKRDRLPHQLSGGEQQRVAIARAMVNSPKILLADEPTGNLDPVTAQEIIDLLFRINDGGTCVIFSTHDHEIVKTFGQRVMVIEDGRLVSDVERRVPERDRAPRLTDRMYSRRAAMLRRAQLAYLARESVAGFSRRRLTTGVTILIMGSALLVLALFVLVALNLGMMLERAPCGRRRARLPGRGARLRPPGRPAAAVPGHPGRAVGALHHQGPGAGRAARGAGRGGRRPRGAAGESPAGLLPPGAGAGPPRRRQRRDASPRSCGAGPRSRTSSSARPGSRRSRPGSSSSAGAA